MSTSSDMPRPKGAPDSFAPLTQAEAGRLHELRMQTHGHHSAGSSSKLLLESLRSQSDTCYPRLREEEA